MTADVVRVSMNLAELVTFAVIAFGAGFFLGLWVRR